MAKKLPNHSFFYDNQLRTIFLHFVRIFSGFNVTTGQDASGNSTMLRVPSIWGDGSRQAQAIISDVSENTLLSVPRIVSYCTNMSIARDRASWAGNTEDLLVSERKFNSDNGTYEGKQGNDYNVTRLMFNPLDITMKVDIVTSNMEQKCQLFEQIYLIFNPVLEMQVYTNPLHWTPIKRVELLEIDWTSQAIPHGDTDELNILSFTFKVEADINPPARVKKQHLINTIIQEMGFGASFDDMLSWGPDDIFYNITTPGNHTIRVDGNQITLLGPHKELINPATNAVYSWPQLIDLYGELQDRFSKIRLRWVSDINDDSEDIIGFISFHPTLDNILLFDVDPLTLPSTTLPNIDGIINPHTSFPGNGLPSASLGQRYLLTDEISVNIAWGNVDAAINDIIEYNGTDWIVTTDSSIVNTIEVVEDSSTSRRFRLVNHSWVDVINNEYLAGYFRLMI